ncbi:helix-turn-helix domain-containing protein [Nocardia sp. ET3-3]|uniref:Helix-turn-helix domain-containing protein n=1 Tax=Nocardia terrae TaxID=2675851 RepID=A0A7K1V5A3_9NOCA|nr:AraC family transcriptional regulator [Nocardia terrae]MVU81776.1 helix-turn-helix domain-containing protein [Nocardia terrae]
MIEGTIPTRIAGLIRATAVRVGVTPAQLAALDPAIDPAMLHEELLRVPTIWAWRAWELIDTVVGPGSGLLATAAADRGGLHVWDYLFTSAPTLAESLRTVVALRGVVTDPGVGWEVVESGGLLTVRESAPIEPVAVLAPIEEFMLSMMLRRIREATRTPLVPVRVAFTHRESARYPHLIDEFGTRRIDFGADHAQITFLDAAALPTGADPHVGNMLRHYAELVLAGSRAVPSEQESMRAVIAACLRDGDLSLDGAARRLAMSPRTLQRRLEELGTGWRAEVESVRHEQAVALIRDTGLSVQSIAPRLGYADARALRRAFQRWTGLGPDEFRRQSRTAYTEKERP